MCFRVENLSQKNFLCTTDFNKFVDCGSDTEPNIAFVTWPEFADCE